MLLLLKILFLFIPLVFYGSFQDCCSCHRYLLVVQIIDSRGEMLPAPIVDTIVQGLRIENLVMRI